MSDKNEIIKFLEDWIGDTHIFISGILGRSESLIKENRESVPSQLKKLESGMERKA